MPAPRKMPLIVTGSVKTSVARAVVKPGSGRIIINGFPAENWLYNPYRMLALTPVTLVPEQFKEVDVEVKVEGGGHASQARAVMQVLARAITSWTRSASIRNLFREFDRHLLSGDPRRKEPKKFGGIGARRRFQKSYR
ncbi:MAG: 30S ribosomal protein S9 [Candidatus Brockarchaeota archaeon]|nr:30S ribosomal protein S9 [Candidatus Brockarchaeota archaeon]